jgi:single-stranded-DNA-specific exonuclease
MHWDLFTEKPANSLDEIIKDFFSARGISNAAERALFLNPSHPHDISLVDVGIDPLQVDSALALLAQAKKENLKVVIFGDYDADGMCATALLWEQLHAVGLDVWPWIPDRFAHGYGLTTAGIEALLKEHQPAVIITVDTGISALAEVAWLREQGISVILTDHHVPKTHPDGTANYPEASSLIHTTQLSGAGVAWFFARACTALVACAQNTSVEQHKNLELAAIASIADMVPLTGVNRAIVAHGLEDLRQTSRPGLQALAETARVELQRIQAREVGFRLSPRLNAMGRMTHGMDAVRLLCTSSKQTAARLATILNETNADRQQLTKELIAVAQAQAHKQMQQQRSLLIVQSSEFHEGVVGLVAGALVREFHRPTIAIAIRDNVIKASARSVGSVHITHLISGARNFMTAYGGHPGAAGFSAHRADLENVVTQLFALGEELISPDDLAPKLAVLCPIDPSLCDEELLSFLSTIEPTGTANEQPLFLLHDLTLLSWKQMGASREHLKVVLGWEGGTLSGVWWRPSAEDMRTITNAESGARGSFAVAVTANEWNGNRSVQLVIHNARL